MAKGGLLNQVPQIDLPTTMNCNVISIGGQTPEEYANLIAQKVTNRNGEPGAYGTGTIDKSPVLGQYIKFDGDDWQVINNDDKFLYLRSYVMGGNVPYSKANELYENSDIRQYMKTRENQFSNIALSIITVPNNIFVYGLNGNPYKIIDKVWTCSIAQYLRGHESSLGDFKFQWDIRSNINIRKENQSYWFADTYQTKEDSAYIFYNNSITYKNKQFQDGQGYVYFICLDKSKLQ